MAKQQVDDFDQDVCSGDHPAYNSPCQYRVAGDEDTGRREVDMIARFETGVLEKATGNEQFKCGKCGCPLVNLDLTNRAPEGCPRVQHHQ